MTDHRKRYDGNFKAKVVVEVLKNQKTIAEIAGEYGIHPNQITQWKKQAMEKLPGILSCSQGKKERAVQEREEELYKEIGKLKVENEWLKKKSGILQSRKREAA